MCKHGDMLSKRVLIGRGLDQAMRSLSAVSLFNFEGVFFTTPQSAPLAQLVEQLTLNQRAPGSSP